MVIHAEDFRPCPKNTLKGFVTLVLPEAGIKIKNCLWHEKAGKQWVAFPAKSFTARDGAAKWTPIVEYSETGATWSQRNAFQSAALAAIGKLVRGAPDARPSGFPVPPPAIGSDLNDAFPF